uniref:Papilin n=1 Tax=Pavo cristatus TaxID=9049 RepID=A0A8C9F0X0_PAVCR
MEISKEGTPQRLGNLCLCSVTYASEDSGAGIPGMWGNWGPWSACSRSCSGGVMEQTRPCLPAYYRERGYQRPGRQYVMCPESSRSIREVQCASYNNKPFMGRFYEWEPFGSQKCELNCRAIGYRFYVRQAEKVIDGTPCDQNGTSICVAGQCKVRLLLSATYQRLIQLYP